MKIIYKILAFILVMTNIVFATNKNYPPTTPWHLADVWWSFNSEINNFINLSIDFKITGKIPNDTLLYIAPIGLGELNGVSFYGGIQTNAGGWRTKEERKIIKFGKGGIFSRWSKDGKPISLDYAQGDMNTYYESAGYEGNFVSVRKKFDWNEGNYTYTIRKIKSVKVNGNIFTWFGAYVYDYKNNVEHYIGSLKFKGFKFKFGKKYAAFIEIYGGEHKSEIPQISVIFNSPKINGKQQILKSIIINYPDNNYKSSNVPRFAYSEVTKNKIKIITIPNGLKDGKKSEIHYPSTKK